MIRRLLAVILLAVSLHAQEKPNAPKPKQDHKVFAAVTALLAGSNIADAITTRQLLDRGGVELNPVFGRHPSPAKQAGINAAFFAGQVLAFHFTERSRKPWLRWLGRVGIGLQIEDHTRLAVCNAELGTRGNCFP